MALCSNKQRRSSFHIFIDNKSDFILWNLNFSTWFKNIVTVWSRQPPFFVTLQGPRPRPQPSQLSTKSATVIIYLAIQIYMLIKVGSTHLFKVLSHNMDLSNQSWITIWIILNVSLIHSTVQVTSTPPPLVILFSCVRGYNNDAQPSDDTSTTLINKFCPALTEVSHTQNLSNVSIYSWLNAN